MKTAYTTILLLLSLFFYKQAVAQIDERQSGAWYMYFYNTTFGSSPWGIQGDFQLRQWNTFGDLEQLLLRSGITYKPKNAQIKFTLGYGNITSGVFGNDNSKTFENRIYQEALYPLRFGKRIYSNHRFRFEQRFAKNQNLRTRVRYNLFLNVALNKPEIEKGSIYLALYNEIFINGQRNFGGSNSVEIFDRNRSYLALGYGIKSNLKIQLGLMRQVTDSWNKNQFQLSIHHNFSVATN
ncbi:MAG: DUF2490 domain-containing protein [Bacteroidia bacterium]